MSNDSFLADLQDVNEIGPVEFAHAKAVFQGVDAKKSALHYLGQYNEAQHQAVLSAVLMILKKEGVKIQAAAQAQENKDTPKVPSLQEFVESKGMQEFGEDECLMAYKEAYKLELTALKAVNATKVQAKECVEVGGVSVTLQEGGKESGWSLVEYTRPTQNPGCDTTDDWFGSRESKALRLIGAKSVEDASLLVLSPDGFEALEFMLGSTTAMKVGYMSRMLAWKRPEARELEPKLKVCQSAMEWVRRKGITKNTRTLCKQACVRWMFWSCEKGIDPLNPSSEDCGKFMSWLMKTEDAASNPWNTSSQSTAEVIGTALGGFLAWSKTGQNPWKGYLHFIRAQKKRSADQIGINDSIDEAGCEVTLRSKALLAITRETGIKLKSLVKLEWGAWCLMSECESSLVFKGMKYSLGAYPTKMMSHYMNAKWLTALPCPDAPMFSKVGDPMRVASYESIREAMLKIGNPSTS